MFCPYCGAHLQDGAKFCSTCGKGIEWPEEVNPAEEPLTQEAFAAYQAQKEAEEKAEYEAWKKSRAEAFQAQQRNQPVVEPFPTAEQSYQKQSQPTVTENPTEEERQLSKSALILAIVGAALAELGLPGLIVSLIAGNKLNQILNRFGKLRGMAIPARWVNLGGKIASIFFTVFGVYMLFVMLIIFSSAY